MRVLCETKYRGKPVKSLDISEFKYKHLRLLQKKELHKNNEVKYRLISSLIDFFTLEDGTVIKEDSSILELTNNLDLYTLNAVLIEAKKFELVPQEKDDNGLIKDHYYISQMQKCSECEAPQSLLFDITNPNKVEVLPDVEIKGKLVTFKIPKKEDEIYLVTHT